MADANVRDILRVPGRLYLNPSDITADPPFGTGTAIGLTRDVEFRMGIRTGIVTAEEWGSAPVELVHSGESAVLACVLREWDDDALAATFVNTGTGAVSGNATILGRVSGAGVNRAGYLISAQSAVLVFAPLSLDGTPAHPMVILRKCLPLVEETAMLQMSLSEELGIAMVWQCIPDSSGRLYDVGARGDLTL